MKSKRFVLDVGVIREPPRFPKPGQVLRSWLQDVGSIDTRLQS